jgi:hypothetical protein
MDDIYFIMLLLLFQNKLFFLHVHFVLSVSLAISFISFFFSGLIHRKLIFNLGETNFSVRIRPTEKWYLTANAQNFFIIIFLCVKYFSDDIRIFLCVFAHIEEFEFPVVHNASSRANSTEAKGPVLIFCIVQAAAMSICKVRAC